MDYTSCSKYVCAELIFCTGQPDIHFVNMVKARKGKTLSEDGKVVAFVDECKAVLGGTEYQCTVRSSDCELVSMTDKCITPKVQSKSLSYS